MLNRQPNSLSRLLQIRRVINKYNLADLVDGLSLSAKARLTSKVLFKTSSDNQAPRGERIRLALEAVSYTHLTLPTIYSV